MVVREYRYEVVPGFDYPDLKYGFGVRTEIPVGEKDAFRFAGRAGSIDE